MIDDTTNAGELRVAKPEWGQKRTCPTCAAKFYDLRLETVVCPVCKTAYDPEKLAKPRRGGSAAREEKAPPPARRPAVVRAEEEDVGEENVAEATVDEVDDDDDDETEAKGLIEDTSDLGEDDDDIGEVMEHVDEDEDKA